MQLTLQPPVKSLNKAYLKEKVNRDNINLFKKNLHRTTFWNADEALSVYKRAHIVVGMEPHSLIMAMAVGVPIIHACPFQFGRKGWMFKDIGLPEWLFDIDKDDEKDIINALFDIHDHYENSRKKVANQWPMLRKDNRQPCYNLQNHW